MTVRESSASRTAAAATAEAAPGAAEVERGLEQHRVELTGYCYRMLGSAFEAEDAVQETLVRAWRGAERFEGRSSLRSWLYRIATNVCLDSLNAGKRRARPMDLSPASHADAVLPDPTSDGMWVEPAPDGRVLPEGGDPADVVVSRESVRLAFVAALQLLPPRQRAVLILREVLAWKADETAELLGTTVASVNSALQRARATLAGAGASTDADPRGAVLDEQHEALLERYVDAFERYDLQALTALLHEDAVLNMPPFPMWVQGHDDIRQFMGTVGAGCAGSRMVPVAASGLPGFAQYRPAPEGGFRAFALQVIETSGDRITTMTSYHDADRLFPLFGLPLELPADSGPA
ncbi:sigma-70 family RNA polymerase sigma factor [Streptomyces sp. NPDC020983]|uniref:sigma-70 family RNA polymerase sigma factor n=1 Tax=Streptomyces sp. NPDC020983 TaxID=3365106 RepID=UPI0037967047